MDRRSAGGTGDHVLDDSIDHEMFYTHRDEEGNRVIGLVGSELKPALFKSNPNRPNVMYRVETDLEELNEEERDSYNSVLASRDVLARLRDDALYEETQDRRCIGKNKRPIWSQ